MEKIISLMLTLLFVLTLMPVTIYSAEEPGYTGGTLIADYMLNKDFAESSLGHNVIYEKESNEFDVTYTSEGTVVTRTTESADTSSTLFDTIVLRLVSNNEDFVNRTETYQTGFSGVHAFEFTFNADLNVEGTTAGRTDFFFGNALDGGRPSQHNIRLASNGSFMCSTGPRFSTYSKGTDRTIRIVVDTFNNKMYGYDVDASVSPYAYVYRGEGEYVQDAITSLMYSLRAYIADGSSVTFKNFKIFEIQRDETNVAYGDFDNFPVSLVADPYNVTENLTLPEIFSSYTVESSDERVLSTSGIITRWEEDKDVSLTISGEDSGCYFEKVYNFTVKAENMDTIADAISVNDITSNPLDAYGNICLPEIPGYDIVWSADSDLVDFENKFIYRSHEDVDITLTATIISNSNPNLQISKDFNISVKGETDPKTLLESSLAKITADSITNQNPDALIADLLLPSVTEEGYLMIWDSLNDNIISDSGIINKQINISENIEVQYKVTVSHNGLELSKDISFTVAKRGADVALDYSKISESVENVVTYQATIANQDGTVYLQDAAGNNIIGIIIADSKLSIDNMNVKHTTTTISGSHFDLKVVMDLSNTRALIYVNNMLVADYVQYIEYTTSFKNVVVNGTSVTNEKVIFDEYSLFDYNNKVYGYYEDSGLPFVGENMSLKTDSIGGVNVKWISSNSAIMTNDGVFTPPEEISFFDVTLKLSVMNGTGAEFEKTTKCVAVPAEYNNVLSDAKVFSTGLIFNDPGKNISNIVDNSYSTYLSADKRLGGCITLDLGSSKDVNSLYFFQSIEDNGIMACDIYVSEDAVTWSENPVASPVFTDYKSNFVKFDTHKARYIRIDNIQTSYGIVKLNEIKGYMVNSEADKVNSDLEALNMPTDRILKVNSLTLPSVGFIYGSTLVWETSDASVISLDGTVTPPDTEAEVILTVIGTYGSESVTKTFTYYFPDKVIDENLTHFKVNSAIGVIGQTVKVPVEIKNNPGVASVKLKILYDSEYLTLTEIADQNILGNANHSDDMSLVPYVLSWENDTVKEAFTNNGEIVELTFEVSENAPVGEYDIMISYDEVLDLDGEFVDFKVVNGIIDVKDYIIGDVNDDGEVNTKDRMTLSRHLASWIGYDVINEAAADVNCDGEVNTKDRMTLSRYLASWIGYETLPYVK